jgi:chemotaxis protein methyltransferase CheR
LEYAVFKKSAGELTGIDLSSYKSQQMDRRINSLKMSWNIETYEEYLNILKTNPQKFQEFVKKLTINVSEFFRNPERFHELWQQILPEMLTYSAAKLRIWSAGCSDGAEPYSVAIIAKELRVESKVQILATDVDKEILNKAKQACYGANEVKSLPPELLGKYFTCEDNLYCLKTQIKEMVEFRSHNLLLDPFETNLDLIICRNVVIYFTEEVKNTLYQKFYRSLKEGGYLLVGGTEPLLNYRQMGFESKISLFYRKAQLSEEQRKGDAR